MAVMIIFMISYVEQRAQEKVQANTCLGGPSAAEEKS